MFNNYDNSRYRAIIKSEQRKVKTTAGLCCTRIGDRVKGNDNIELLNQILRDNGNCISANDKNGDMVLDVLDINSSRYINCNCSKRKNKNERNESKTNIYRFINQNFLDNALGNSNVIVSDIHRNNNFDKRMQIENILRRYNKNCRCRRK